MEALVHRVLVFVDSTIKTKVRSGVQRVVVELSRALLGRIKVDFVKWDDIAGQLCFADTDDLEALFGAQIDSRSLVNPWCHRVSYRFGDTMGDQENAWLIFPEIPYFSSRGNDDFSRIISQCKEYGIKVAPIFYDLIPLREPEYAAASSQHLEYMLELLRADRILAISHFSARDLLAFYEETAVFTADQLAHLASKVHAIPLGEQPSIADLSSPSLAARDASEGRSIVLLGTIEPRKQQVRFLRIFNDLTRSLPELSKIKIHVFGSLHPLSADGFHHELSRNSNVSYHQYATDEIIDHAVGQAAFSVFISKSEGFGLPIVESLSRGTPCLTASFGSMAEVASGGGCLLTDVLSDEAIAESIKRLFRDSELLPRLRQEIAKRTTRSWVDYANDVCSALTDRGDVDDAVSSNVLAQLRVASEKLRKSEQHQFSIYGQEWKLTIDRADSGGNASHSEEFSGYNRYRIVVVTKPIAAEGETASRLLRDIADADIVCLPNSSCVRPLLAAMRQLHVDRLLPEDVVFCSVESLASSDLASRILKISQRRNYLASRSMDECLFGRFASRVTDSLQVNGYELAIVISTFNRAAFTELNLSWLVELTKDLQTKVCIVVVDNASTDDTVPRLQKYLSVPNVILKVNSQNVGMLGNLHVASTLVIAKHVWLTGDDDYIREGAIERVIQILAANPRVPLIAHNFSVYYRTSLSPDDSPVRFEAESTALCPGPTPSGMRPIVELAHEHDNLFTAIYPLVFRSDIAAACFNYPFDGVPFGDLVESVPTTKIVLESLGFCDGYWISEVGVTGNAHNSWSGHRPRWHLVLMPKVFYLTRALRMEPGTVWKWLNIHLDLFYESIQIAVNGKQEILLKPQEIEMAEWIFQAKITIPDNVVVCAQPSPPFLHFPISGNS